MSTKRLFRSQISATRGQPVYPTLDDFDSNRRGFLVRLGTALLGAGALGALPGCGSRPVPGTDPDPDLGGPEGVAPMMDARSDVRPGHDLPPTRPEMTIGGGMPQPDSRTDGWPKPDVPIMPGEAPDPDARVDLSPSPGYANVMDSRLDDSGTCPNP